VSLEQKISELINFGCIKDTTELAKRILALPSGIKVVERCLWHVNVYDNGVLIKPCEHCDGTGQIIRDLTLAEAIERAAAL